MKKRLVLSCEHAGNDVPAAYQHLFEHADDALASHRGWDPGAIQIAEVLADEFGVDLHHCLFTRLLVEPNRSLDSPQLFSEFTSQLEATAKNVLIWDYYLPYRNSVESEMANLVNEGFQVVHVSIHSFTPIWDGKERKVDIGLLFDDKRENEWELCLAWQKQLNQSLKNYKIRLNEPYNGADDGFTTYLRSRFPRDQYLGIEIEVNQKYGDTDRDYLARKLVHSLSEVLGN